jgi:hypothetical protein
LLARWKVERIALRDPLRNRFQVAVFAEFDEREEFFDTSGGGGMLFSIAVLGGVEVGGSFTEEL